MKMIFVYGSLKRGCFNHKWTGMDRQKFLGETTITGLKMYSLGSFPCVVETGRVGDQILAERYEVDNDTFEKIRAMELGSGYREATITDVHGNVGVIWAWDERMMSMISGCPDVPDGVWREKR